ncbi:MAG: YciI family protein [Flavobacteriales bacterium]
MEEYALIMRHENGAEVASPEQMARWMEQTRNWIAGMAAQHKFVKGTGLLFDDACVLSNHNGQLLLSDGAFGEKKQTIGGLIIIRAESPEEAATFARDCPVLQGEGNSVEIRRVLNGEE